MPLRIDSRRRRLAWNPLYRRRFGAPPRRARVDAERRRPNWTSKIAVRTQSSFGGPEYDVRSPRYQTRRCDVAIDADWGSACLLRPADSAHGLTRAAAGGHSSCACGGREPSPVGTRASVPTSCDGGVRVSLPLSWFELPDSRNDLYRCLPGRRLEHRGGNPEHFQPLSAWHPRRRADSVVPDDRGRLASGSAKIHATKN